MTQCMVHVGKLEKKVHSVVVGCSVLQIFMKYLISLRLQARGWGFKVNLTTWPLPQRNSHSSVGEILKIQCIPTTYGDICTLLYIVVSFCLECNFLYIFPVRLL